MSAVGSESDDPGVQPEPSVVAGDRGVSLVNSARSMQSRVSGFLAAGLMIALGIGALSWYYANALSRQKQQRQVALSATNSSAQGEMALPPLVGVLPPSLANESPGALAEPTHSSAVPAELPVPTTAALPAYNAYGANYAPRRETPPDRRLTGAAFARESGGVSATAGATFSGEQESAAASAGPDAAPMPTSRLLAGQLGAPQPVSRGEEGLGALLRPTLAAPAQAEMLPTRQLLLPKGAFIDCTLETAIDSTLPGMTTCVTATDTFSVNGKIVLLERGSKLIGETRGEVQNGAARVFVLWSEARTPTGVRVPLDSPGTDELGRSGLPGEVNRHFWDRFGAAVLISVIDGAVQATVQSTTRGNGTLIYNPSTSQEALTDILKGTVNIPPTVIKHQGDRIQILVARDLDFRSVYELHIAGRW